MTPAQPALLAPVIAHRGASGHAPENTLAALQLAHEQGARCVEVDVAISADGIPFLHHDDTLERCTDGSGRLCEHDALALDELRAGKRHIGFDQEPLPRLTAALALLIAHDMGLNLELKPAAGLAQRTTERVCEVIGSCWPVNATLVLSSFDEQALITARQWQPDIPRALITGAVPEDFLTRLTQLECRNLHCAGDQLTSEAAAAVKAAGYGLYCYTVNDIEQARSLMAMGVDGIFTDYPDRMASLSMKTLRR